MRARQRCRARGGKTATRWLYSWDFTGQSGGAATIPTGLTFTRASSGHTVQTGTSTITTTGITSNDVGRIGRILDAHNYGLFFEPARTNLVIQNRAIDGSPWAVGSSVGTTANASNGPDGAALADRSNVSSGGYSRYQSMTSVVSSSYTFSQWIAARSTAQNHRVALAETVAAYTLIQTSSAPTTWQRINSTRTATTTTLLLLPCDGSDRTANSGPGAQAMDFFTDLHQVELGKYPTSAIVTAGSTATRAAERLTIDATRTAASIVNGRLCIYLRFRALAALSEMSSSVGQITCEAAGTPTYGWFIGASSKYVYANVGSDYSQSANSVIDWSRYDLVEIACEIGGGKSKFRYRRNGGSTTEISFSVRDDTLGAIPSSNGCDILCAGTSFHTPGIVERVSTYLPGRSPI